MQRFIEIGRAYEVLSDEAKRKEFLNHRFDFSDEDSFSDAFDLFESFVKRYPNLMSQTTSTSFVNGTKTTRVSMFKSGLDIDEVYEDDVLVQRKIGGVVQNMTAPTLEERVEQQILREKERIEDFMRKFGLLVLLANLTILQVWWWLCCAVCNRIGRKLSWRYLFCFVGGV